MFKETSSKKFACDSADKPDSIFKVAFNPQAPPAQLLAWQRLWVRLLTRPPPLTDNRQKFQNDVECQKQEKTA